MSGRPSTVMLCLFALGRWLGRREWVYALLLGLNVGFRQASGRRLDRQAVKKS